MFVGDRKPLEYLRRFDSAIQGIQARGYLPRKSSRAFHYRATVASWAEKPTVDWSRSSDRRAVSQALNAYYELNQLIPGLEFAALHHVPANDLDILFAGHVSAAKDQSAGRDYQAHFRLAATLDQAGFACRVAGVDPGCPTDVITEVETVPVGIEVKRVSSIDRSKLYRRYREAEDQLLKRGGVGLVALDVSRHLSRESVPAEFPTEESAANSADALIDGTQKWLGERIFKEAKPLVDGAILWATLPALVHGVGLFTKTRFVVMNLRKAGTGLPLKVAHALGQLVIRETALSRLPTSPSGFRA